MKRYPSCSTFCCLGRSESTITAAIEMEPESNGIYDESDRFSEGNANFPRASSGISCYEVPQKVVDSDLKVESVVGINFLPVSHLAS
ncbi:hypothetical protein L218DRAFT_238907 [Marasmius fiardii PR-910]|nr:hypothetical protein L218DRAFT_238907 [Marasmius fiardii PR-910]